MAEVEIEYCVPCGLLEPALETERALLEALGQELEGVRLRTGHGGVFRVSLDGEVLFDKADGDAYDSEKIVTRVREGLGVRA